MLAPVDSFNTDIIKSIPMLRRFAIQLCRNIDYANDLVQETMLRALLKKNQFERGTNLDAWLLTILRNYYLSQYWKHWRMVADPDMSYASQVAVEDDPSKRMEVREVLSYVEQLPPKFRDILLLIGDGASYEEIAEEQIEPIGTIKSRVHRAREFLGRGV